MQEEHDLNFELFLNAIRQNNFTLNQTETIKLVQSVQILGCVVEKGFIKPDSDG